MSVLLICSSLIGLIVHIVLMIGASRAGKTMLSRRMTHAAYCPFGRQPDPLDPARLIDHPAEQATISIIKAARAKGRGYKAIAHMLEAKGIPCRGERWHHTTVRSILRRAALLAEVS